jgi:cell division protein FtsW
MAVLTRIREVAVVRRDNRTDKVLMGTMLLLSGFGLLMIYSATQSTGSFSMERQMIFVAAGIIVYFVASNIDYREYRLWIPIASLIIMVLLVVVFFFDPVNGAQRWIELGFFK